MSAKAGRGAGGAAGRTPALDAAWLAALLGADFPLARHLGIVVESADDAGIVLRAPLAPNANDKGTAFGGSLYCVAVLAGWSWVTRHLRRLGLAADAVIQESAIRYLVPVTGELRAEVSAPAPDAVEKFEKALRRAGRGRISLRVQVRENGVRATEFEGLFAAVIR